MNKEFIAKNLCVKKAVKGNCCKGSCHLAKELKADEQKAGSPGTPSSKDKNETQLFFQSLTTFNLSKTIFNLYYFAPYKEKKLVSYSFPVFHPPCFMGYRGV